MEDVNIKQNTQEKRNKKLLTLAFVLLFLVVAFFSLSFIFLFPKTESLVEKNFEEKGFSEVEVFEENLKGAVFLTIFNKDGGSNIYTWDLSTDSVSSFFPKDSYSYASPSFSSNMEEMLFVRSCENGVSQVFHKNILTEEISELTSCLDFFVRDPFYTSEGKNVVFWSCNFTGGFTSGCDTSLENSVIYILDLETREITEIAGALPFLLNKETDFMFLSKEGVLEMNIEDLESSLVIPAKELATDSVEDFHDTGVDSTSPFNFDEGVLTMIDFPSPTWPVFSPESDFLIFRSVKEDSSFSLGVYNFEQKAVVKEKLLKGDHIEDVWINFFLPKAL